jgi:uncharacterized protein
MDAKHKRFELRLPDERWAQIDEWRRRQPDLPNRTEAVRRLLTLALEVGLGAKVEREPRKPEPQPLRKEA